MFPAGDPARGLLGIKRVIDRNTEKGEDEVKGHIRERSPGHWAIILDVRDQQTGARKRRWHSFKGGKRE